MLLGYYMLLGFLIFYMLLHFIINDKFICELSNLQRQFY